MKTRILHLETHDDLISIRDRMAWAKSPRILLVWPRRGGVDLRPLDLKLLQRHASSLGSQLGLVTRNARIREEAGALGIPAFASMSEAQRGAWPGTSRKPSLRRQAERPDPSELRAQIAGFRKISALHPNLRLAVFSLGVLAVLAVVTLFIPSAEISLEPVTTIQEVTLPVSAGAGVTAVSLSGSLPARSVTLAITLEGEIPSTGRLAVPVQKASGRVSLANLTASPLAVPAGTVLHPLDEPSVRYVTTGGGTFRPETGATLELPVEALQPGAAGNLEAGTALVLEGTLGPSVTAVNPAPLRGGTDRLAAAPSDADREALRRKVLAGLSQKALSEVQAALTENDLILAGTVTVGDPLDETFDPAEGAAGETLRLSLTVEVSAVYLSASDLEQLASAVLDSALEEGFVPVEGTLTVEGMGAATLEAGDTYGWRVRASRLTRPDFDPLALLRLVQGRSPRNAARQLEQALALDAAPEINLKPGWWPLLPFTPLRIAINY
ncbi:MAG: baseplate J/gp47 family protein [Chloroflexota bacterium]